MKRLIAWYLRNFSDTFSCNNEKMRTFPMLKKYMALNTQPIEYWKVGKHTLWIRRTNKKHWFEKLVKL